MKLLIVIAFLFPLQAAADWSSADTKREVAWQIINVIDWGTTLDIENYPDITEGNIFMGRNPTRDQVNFYMAGYAVIHYVVSSALKPKYRKVWQYITIIDSANAITNNFRLGLRINF